MASIRKRPRKNRSLGAIACCGRVCDERCSEISVRDAQFGRRLGIAGGFRVS